jgi:hypothetical protein
MGRSLRSRLVAGGDRAPPSGIPHLFPHGLFFSITSVTRSGGNLCDLDRTSRPFTLKELDHDPVGFPDPSCRDAPQRATRSRCGSSFGGPPFKETLPVFRDLPAERTAASDHRDRLEGAATAHRALPALGEPAPHEPVRGRPMPPRRARSAASQLTCDTVVRYAAR